MAQWIRLLAVEARGPKFNPPYPCKKPGMVSNMSVTPVLCGVGTGGSLGLSIQMVS